MTGKPPPETERVRAAEVIAASCLATDLGMGFPFEHGLHATLMTMRHADLLGVDSETASQTYYACLLMYSGCTTDAEVAIRIFRGGMTKNVTHRQFGSATESLKGVIRALPPPDSPAAPPSRRDRVATAKGGWIPKPAFHRHVRGSDDACRTAGASCLDQQTFRLPYRALGRQGSARSGARG